MSEETWRALSIGIVAVIKEAANLPHSTCLSMPSLKATVGALTAHLRDEMKRTHEEWHQPTPEPPEGRCEDCGKAAGFHALGCPRAAQPSPTTEAPETIAICQLFPTNGWRSGHWDLNLGSGVVYTRADVVEKRVAEAVELAEERVAAIWKQKQETAERELGEARAEMSRKLELADIELGRLDDVTGRAEALLAEALYAWELVEIMAEKHGHPSTLTKAKASIAALNEMKP